MTDAPTQFATFHDLYNSLKPQDDDDTDVLIAIDFEQFMDERLAELGINTRALPPWAHDMRWSGVLNWFNIIHICAGHHGAPHIAWKLDDAEMPWRLEAMPQSDRRWDWPYHDMVLLWTDSDYDAEYAQEQYQSIRAQYGEDDDTTITDSTVASLPSQVEPPTEPLPR